MRNLTFGFLFLCLTFIGCSPNPHAQSIPDVADAAAKPSGHAVIVWVSMDGFRHDYIDKANTPFFHKLMAEGSYSKQLTTITPSLTFPSHVSEATGVPASEHGIPANDFYDAATHKQYSFPAAPQMLQAEPIWLTAPRQGVRTLVYDWPFAYGFTSDPRPDYFQAQFQNALTDEQRLNRLLEAWMLDQNPKPLSLLMAYIKHTDTNGHKYGPDAPETKAAVEEMDQDLSRFVTSAKSIFDQKSKPEDELYILLTTDHGMMPVKTLVNFEKLLAKKPSLAVQMVTSGPLGMIYLDQVPSDQTTTLKASMLEDLRKWDFVSVYTRETLPPDWRLAHPTRVGDIVVMLKPGYSFSTRLPLATFPVEKVGGPLGMHGYPPPGSPEMLGFCVLWRYRHPLGGHDLGKVDVLQLHPTVAKLLGIHPSEKSKAAPIAIK
jgi:predicted AlkP superfamily pyrophosphatase or phosphodiesterase